MADNNTIQNNSQNLNTFVGADRRSVDDFANLVSPLLNDRADNTSLLKRNRSKTSKNAIPEYLEFDDNNLDTASSEYDDYVQAVQAVRTLASDAAARGINIERPEAGNPDALLAAQEYQRLYTNAEDLALKLRMSEETKKFQRENAIKENLLGPLTVQPGQTATSDDFNLRDISSIQETVKQLEGIKLAQNEDELVELQEIQRGLLQKLTQDIQRSNDPTVTQELLDLYTRANLAEPLLDTKSIAERAQKDDLLNFNKRKQTETERKNKSTEGIQKQNANTSSFNAQTSRLNTGLRQDELNFKIEGGEENAGGGNDVIYDTLQQAKEGVVTDKTNVLPFLFASDQKFRTIANLGNVVVHDIEWNKKTNRWDVVLRKDEEQVFDKDGNLIKDNKRFKSFTEGQLVKIFGKEGDEDEYQESLKRKGKPKETKPKSDNPYLTKPKPKSDNPFLKK